MNLNLRSLMIPMKKQKIFSNDVMIIQYRGVDYELITNYAYYRLVEKCCEEYKLDTVPGKVFVSWLLKNKYIARKKK